MVESCSATEFAIDVGPQLEGIMGDRLSWLSTSDSFAKDDVSPL